MTTYKDHFLGWKAKPITGKINEYYANKIS